MNRPVFLSIFLLAMIFLFYSCGTSCDCNKNLGCKILTLKNAGGSIIMTKTYCSQTDYDTDVILRDSVKAFYTRYNSVTTRIDERDSIYKYETVRDLKIKETEQFESKGYGCACSK